jgi:hypothetical protein
MHSTACVNSFIEGMPDRLEQDRLSKSMAYRLDPSSSSDYGPEISLVISQQAQ